jgi:oligopeptide/dipeptide ABC transporter ATP-binding protein
MRSVTSACTRAPGYRGRSVEQGPARELFARPAHPYTKALVTSIPALSSKAVKPVLAGEPRSPVNPDPKVCRFYGRCPQQERCREEAPALAALGSGRSAACHFAQAA